MDSPPGRQLGTCGSPRAIQVGETSEAILLGLPALSVEDEAVIPVEVKEEAAKTPEPTHAEDDPPVG